MVYSIRQYGLPLVLALALHSLAVLALYSGWNPQQETRVIRPQIVKSTLLVLEPDAKPKPQPRAAPPPKPAAETRPKPDPQADRRRKAEAEAKNQAQEKARERELAEAHARAQAEAKAKAEEISTARAEDAARQQKLEALADASFLDALEDEALDLQAQSETADSEAVTQSFQLGIYQAVVGNWSRPPSARNGMQAKLRVELVPTGDVVAVSLVESSGNGAFDRSAEAAVRKARRFEVPKDPELFEQYFRRFTLLFRPEDLLR
jgi:colicin import membrane protein